MRESLISKQTQFSATMREQHNACDHPAVKRYQHLVMNNFYQLISRCFPVLFSILPQALLEQLLSNFVKQTKTATPLFYQLPAFFMRYLQSYQHQEYPFIAALAHYEWIELEVDLAEEDIVTPYPANFDALAYPLRLANSACLLHYDYDVENICRDYLPQEKIASYLVVYRDRNYHVQFLSLNAPSHNLLHSITTSGKIARSLLANDMLEYGRDFLSSLLHEGVLVLCPKQAQNKRLSSDSGSLCNSVNPLS